MHNQNLLDKQVQIHQNLVYKEMKFEWKYPLRRDSSLDCCWSSSSPIDPFPQHRDKTAILAYREGSTLMDQQYF